MVAEITLVAHVRGRRQPCLIPRQPLARPIAKEDASAFGIEPGSARLVRRHGCEEPFGVRLAIKGFGAPLAGGIVVARLPLPLRSRMDAMPILAFAFSYSLIPYAPPLVGQRLPPCRASLARATRIPRGIVESISPPSISQP